MSLYTPSKVFHRLAAKLPTGRPTTFDVCRWSVEMGSTGIAKQRQVHISTYSATSPDLQEIGSWPEDAWDPQLPEIGARYGIEWLALEDLHHSARGDDRVIGIVLVGQTLFASVTLSTMTRHIKREDGEDENATLVFILAVLNHYTSIRQLRYGEDVTRAAREDLGWALQKQKCHDRDIRLVLGGREYDLKDTGYSMALKALGIAASNDDPARRIKLTGARVLQSLAGGAVLADDQLPLGWGHELDEHDRKVPQGGKGHLLRANDKAIQALQQLYTSVAAGDRWTSIGLQIVELESEGKIVRRAHSSVGATYADCAGSPSRLYDAAKQIFVRSGFRPDTIPSEESINAYEAGADPLGIFDIGTRLFLCKTELMRTGRYLRRQRNDIRGRGLVLHGLEVAYADETDEYGWWDVLSEPWPWPKDPATGLPLERFGITDEVCRKVGARLLRELRAPASPTGGRAHNRVNARILRNFDRWFTMPWETGAQYQDEPTEFMVQARQNANAKENFIILFRRRSVGHSGRSGGRRGQNWFVAGEIMPDHIAATGSLRELTASVSISLRHALEDLVEGDLATAREATADSTDKWQDDLKVARARERRLDKEVSAAKSEATGLRAMAGRKAAAGDLDAADRYDSQASRQDQTVIRLALQVQALRDQMISLTATDAPAQQHNDEVNITVGAYLVAGLDRAVNSHVRGPQALTELADRTLVDWKFVTNGDELTWHCSALLPLRAGGALRQPLTGIIRNVRERAGKATATPAIVARYMLEEGRDLDEVAAVLEVSRKTAITQRAMPWLVSNGVTSRGAKNALLDHPVHMIRRIAYAAITGRDQAVVKSWPDAVVALIRETYLDPALQWGDAACPDNVVPQMRLAATLTSQTNSAAGITIQEAALMLGVPELIVRRWIVPVPRYDGFQRPQYFRYVPGSAKKRIQLLPCTHGRCRGVASHVVLLPEVAASGFGVLCNTCRRVPADPESKWGKIAFPAPYLGSFTNVDTDSGLRETAQTVRISSPVSLDVETEIPQAADRRD